MSVALLNEIKSISSEKSDLRQFAFTVGAVLATLGVFLIWRGKVTSPALFLCGVGLIVAGYVLPGILLPLQKAWMTLALLMGWVMTRVLLSVLFYAVLTPIAILARLCRKQFLEMTVDSTADSYWQYRQEAPFDRRHYEQQF